jgi:hypothetical protein
MVEASSDALEGAVLDSAGDAAKAGERKVGNFGRGIHSKNQTGMTYLETDSRLPNKVERHNHDKNSMHGNGRGSSSWHE